MCHHPNRARVPHFFRHRRAPSLGYGVGGDSFYHFTEYILALPEVLALFRPSWITAIMAEARPCSNPHSCLLSLGDDRSKEPSSFLGEDFTVFAIVIFQEL